MTASHESNSLAQSLLEQGKSAYQGGKKSEAFYLFSQALQHDPQSEQAWIWLSAVVDAPGERRFCLERALAINPYNEAYVRGVQRLPADLQSQPPFPGRRNDQGQELCTFPGCQEFVSRPGHKWCYKHWRLFRAPQPTQRQQPNAASAVVATAATPQTAPAPQQSDATLLTATLLAERLALRDRNINQMLSDLGWISADRQGWTVTDLGKEAGAVQRFNPQHGTPFVLWPETILTNQALKRMVHSLKGVQPEPAKLGGEQGFRERFPAQHRTTDGHWVRSKAEMLIDNWLYMAGVVHAYERQLPIEEEAYCDFYIPAGKVYIEYWGYERDQNYLARRQEKVGLYQKYQFNLIQLTDEHVKNLDDHLPRMLIRFGVAVS